MTIDQDAVVTEFRRRIGTSPAAVVRAPGRVNVIGEHTDYSGLPVMPMAIQRSLFVAAGPADRRRVTAHSMEFGDAAVDLDDDDDTPQQGWGRYLASAIRELDLPCGAELVAGGDLPSEAGLSSSAALMTAVVAALALVGGSEPARDLIVARAIDAEQRVGVRSGGMDQTIVVHAQAGSLLRIEFDPPSRRVVRIPDGLSFVIADSGERAAKAGPVRVRYNELVLATRLAAIILSRDLGGEVQTRLSRVRGRAGLLDAVARMPEQASALDLVGDAGAMVELLPPGISSQRPVAVAAAARHVLSEAERVDGAEAALRSGDLGEFGASLDASHASLRDELHCSTSALDRLCAAMRDAGAIGARLTGAGFGGYAVAAVDESRIDAVLTAATSATGGPAFVAVPSDGLSWT